MKIFSWILDLSISKSKNNPLEIKRKISDIILLDRLELKKTSVAKNSAELTNNDL